MTSKTNEEIDLKALSQRAQIMRGARQVFASRGATLNDLQTAAGDLKAIGEKGAEITRFLLDTFDRQSNEAKVIILELTDYFLDEAADYTRWVDGVNNLLTHQNSAFRKKALEIITRLGPRAAPAETAALGCLRNRDAHIRLTGAKILHAIGSACSRSIIPHLKTVLARNKNEITLHKTLNELLALLNNQGPADRPKGSASQPSKASARQALAIPPEKLSEYKTLLRNKQILLVEDDPQQAQALMHVLKQFDVRLSYANDGEIAIGMIHTGEVPDLVLLDLMLPKKNGAQVLQEMRHDLSFISVPVIVISALKQEAIAPKLARYDILDYIAKPYRIADILDRLGAHFAVQMLNK